MKPLNTKAIIFLGGIVIIALGYQLCFVDGGSSYEGFDSASDIEQQRKNVQSAAAVYQKIMFPVSDDDKRILLTGIKSGFNMGVAQMMPPPPRPPLEVATPLAVTTPTPTPPPGITPTSVTLTM